MVGVFSSLFKQRKPKQFSFKPLYYNAEKEAREKRIELIKKEISLGNEGLEFRKLLREKWKRNQTVAKKKSNLRVIVIAAILALLFYFLLK